MKIRTGFVSNSSSSSFVIIGNVIDKATKDMKIFCHTEFFGENGRIGGMISYDDFITLSSIEDHEDYLTFYNVIAASDYKSTILTANLNEKSYEVIADTYDYYFTIEDVKNRIANY